MADFDGLISKLDKPKRTGEGKWLACCPSHNDRSPSLAIKQDGGKILIHCFAGCSVDEILSAVGLDMSDLMPERPSYKKGSKPTKFNKYELFDRLIFESTILLIAIKQLFNDGSLSQEDMARVIRAEETIDDIARECRR